MMLEVAQMAEFRNCWMKSQTCYIYQLFLKCMFKKTYWGRNSYILKGYVCYQNEYSLSSVSYYVWWWICLSKYCYFSPNNDRYIVYAFFEFSLLILTWSRRLSHIWIIGGYHICNKVSLKHILSQNMPCGGG